MIRIDLRILCMALGFTVVASRDTKISGKQDIRRAMDFATLIEEFCVTSMPDVFGIASISSVLDSDLEKSDRIIDRHIDELKVQETTRLPEDRAELLKYYDRLQQRKMRRMQTSFYETADLRILADRILKYLDEEIEDGEGR